VADVQGAPHIYQSPFDEARGDYAEYFLVAPISAELLSLVLEDWEIWIRWERAFKCGEASTATHPAPPAERGRHEELERLIGERLALDATTGRKLNGEFRSTPDGFEEVQWSELPDETRKVEHFTAELGYTGVALSAIHLPDLSAFTQPEWNNAEALPAALDSVLSANNEQSSQEAYHRLLYAVGNDHAGTYHPVALGILPTLGQILRIGGPWPQCTVLEVLIELYGSFQPEPGHGTFHGEPLQQLVRSAISDLLPLVNMLRNSKLDTARSANELLTLINEA
jgi:hypothetical protein